jgi:ubiquinone/menaquinone biosynthesis C-methylase UbiE
MAAQGFHMTGTDIDADMVEEACTVGQVGTYHVVSVDHLDFPDTSFDGATAFGAFH